MRRRLRKKRRLGEFREDCFELEFHIDPTISKGGIDSIINSFIDMIEARGLQYGGGGIFFEWSGVVQGPYRQSATEQDRDFVLSWLRANPRVVYANAGPLRDAWHDWD